jgi:5-methyltetrahydropteroyltriglutamate--homocysteine methyltransferase
MSARADRILTTHVGSLPRPADLVSFMRPIMAGAPYDREAHAECLRRSVKDIVAKQVALGIDIVSDGEFGKTSWARYAVDRLAGLEARTRSGPSLQHRSVDRARFADYYAEYDKTVSSSGPNVAWIVTGPLRYTGQRELQRDIDNLKSALPSSGGTQGFLPVVAPASVLPERQDAFYGSDEKCLVAIAEALRTEYRTIGDAGLVVQIDDAWLTGLYDRMVPPGTLADYRRWAESQIAALNYALEGIPEERTRYHICWGSWSGPHTSDVPFKDIIDLVLKLRVGAYSFEAGNVRHEHEWRLWEHVKLPDGRKLLPGVVSHATNVVEHPELVAERLVRLANLVGRENVVASTDCGFAQGALYSRVHPSIVWAKLEALVEGARLATQALWARGQTW